MTSQATKTSLQLLLSERVEYNLNSTAICTMHHLKMIKDCKLLGLLEVLRCWALQCTDDAWEAYPDESENKALFGQSNQK